MYKSIKRFAFGGSAVIASVLAIAATSIAAPKVERYRNLATGFCLQSNGTSLGSVYTTTCSNSSNNQKWTVISSGTNRILQNVATGYCLDSNRARQVYALKCNGGNNQKWTVIRNVVGKSSYLTFKNVETKNCLDSNTTKVSPKSIARQVYTQACNNGSFQKWY